jgi:tetratricopeptide (TPR) repeat protein
MIRAMRAEGEAVRAREKADKNLNLARTETERANENLNLARTETERAKSAERKARDETRLSSATSNFLVEMFYASDPIGLHGTGLRRGSDVGGNLMARDILDRGVQRIDDLKEVPLVQARLKETLGNVYRSLALYGKADPLLQEALQIRRKMLPPDHPDVATSLHNLGWMYFDQGLTEEAEPRLREALEIRRKIRGGQDGSVAESLFQLAWLLADKGEHAEAEALFREVVEIRCKLPRQGRELAIAYLGLAGVLVDQARGPDAIQYIIKAAPELLKLEGMFDLVPALYRFEHAMALRQMAEIGSIAKRPSLIATESSLRECLELARKALGPDHPVLAYLLYELARTCEMNSKDVEAKDFYEQCLALVRKTVTLSHPRAGFLVRSYAELLRRQGEDSEGMRLCDQLIEERRIRRGPGHPLVADALALKAYLELGSDIAHAERTYMEALHIYKNNKNYNSQERRYLDEVTAPRLRRRKIDGLIASGQQQWNRAAEDYARALELDPRDHWDWYRSAALQLRVGALERYHQHCREMLRRFGETQDPAIAERVAKTCLLAPEGLDDITRPRRLAGHSYRRNPNDEWFVLVKGLADYRAGLYKAALDELDQGLKVTRDLSCRALSYLVQSMAYARMGQAVQARQSFHQAIRIELGGQWHDWMHCQIIRHEAEALVFGGSPELPADVFAPLAGY